MSSSATDQRGCRQPTWGSGAYKKRKTIVEELAGRQGMTKEQLESAFQTATAKPHGFLFISYDAPPGEKLWSGFSKKLVNK